MKKASRDELNSTRRSKNELARRDVFGRTVLHISILLNSPDSLQKLLRSPDIKHVLMLTDYENGWNILHYIFYYKRISCLKVLIEYLDQTSTQGSASMLELLKCKDRARISPLSLLQNDAKDLTWIPEYINEKNEYHLKYRFGTDETGTRTYPRYIKHDWWLDSRGGSELYVFGANTNNNLGMGDSTDRSAPSRLSYNDFKPGAIESLADMLYKPRFQDIKISKYHAVVITLDGSLFTCGVGLRGRLGHGNSVNQFKYKSVDYFRGLTNNGEVCLTKRILKTAVSNNHTLALTTTNELFAWGHNSFRQLGVTTILEKNAFKNSHNDFYENTPKEVNTGDLRKLKSRIRGIEASKIHSVAYTKDSVYFWGLNIGQMGIIASDDTKHEHRVNGTLYKGPIVPHPKVHTIRDEIKLVSTCETATCVVSVTNDIYVYYMHLRVKLPKLPSRGFSEKLFDSFKPSRLTTAPSIKKISMKSHDHVHILLESGDVMTFALSSMTSDLKNVRNVRFSYLWKAYDSDMRAVDIDSSYDGSVIVCAKNGSVFIKSCQSGASQRKGSMSGYSTPVNLLTTRNRFTKLENVNRILRVTCDDSFSSFGLIRDDIDTLPLKLQKNDFIKDLEYLSVLVESDLYRKQDQLLDVDHDTNSYVTDYLYPKKPLSSWSDDELMVLNGLAQLDVDDDVDDDQASKSQDSLQQKQALKFNYRKNSLVKLSEMYQHLNEYDMAPLFTLLKSESEVESQITQESCNDSEKFYDGQVQFLDNSDIVIGFHTKLLEYRSTFCKQIFHPADPGEYFIHDGLEGNYDPETKTLLFKSNVDVRAVVILLHFLYTNKVLSFWDMYPGGLKCPEPIRKVKADFNKLMDLFRLDSLYGKDDAFVGQLQQMAEDDVDGDVLVTLKGGQQLCLSSILVARSAFFETILSQRWDTGDQYDLPEDEDNLKLVSLENITPVQFKIIKKHLHGCDDLKVFEPVFQLEDGIMDSDDFVNFLLDMIEISDELLLVQLKHLCELAIKEFLNLDNVLILLAHSHGLNARKLFMSCCWYIYNNLDIVLFDASIRDLESGLLRDLEKQLSFLQTCRLPEFVVGEYGETNSSMCCYPLEGQAPELVDGFLTDPTEFNEIFMSDRKGFSSFEPLVDVKVDIQHTEDTKRRQSRRMSRKSSIDPLLELRNLSLTNKLSERRASESAVADDDEFELVTSRRRKSKTEAKPGAKTEHKVEKPIDVVDIIDLKSTEQSGKPSEDRSTSPSAVQSSGALLAPLGSRNSSSSSIYSAPVLGEQIEKVRRPTKIKFAPSMKLSQKHRKKGTLSEPVEGSSASLASPILLNPWKVATPTVSAALEDLPILGETKKAPAPRLTAIMLQESTRLEDQREQERQRKTLQEIQQEQEFAKWWEEESKRVQNQNVVDVPQNKHRRRKKVHQ